MQRILFDDLCVIYMDLITGKLRSEQVNENREIITHRYDNIDDLMQNMSSNTTDVEIYCNERIDNLPRTIESLMVRGCFNQSLSCLSDSIKYLTICGIFNMSLDNLPFSVEYLYIHGDEFNQPIDFLTNSIIHLELEGKFNQPIDHLPDSIKHLKLGVNFNQPINYLPDSINYLEICCSEKNGNIYIAHNIDLSKINKSITTLTFTTKCNSLKNRNSKQKVIDITTIPKTVKKIIFPYTEEKVNLVCEILMFSSMCSFMIAIVIFILLLIHKNPNYMIKYVNALYFLIWIYIHGYTNIGEKITKWGNERVIKRIYLRKIYHSAKITINDYQTICERE